MPEMLDQRLDRREAGAAGDEQHGALGILARHEGAQRTFHAQYRAGLQAVEHEAGEAAAGDVAHVQLDLRLAFGRVGDGERAAFAVGQQHVEILPGQAGQAFAVRRLQDQLHHVGREPALVHELQCKHAARNVGDRGHFAREQGQIAAGHGLAQQHLVARLLAGVQRGRRVARIGDLAADQARLAAAADAGQTGIGQSQAGALGGFEHAFAGLHGETLAAGLQGDGMAQHGVPLERRAIVACGAGGLRPSGRRREPV